MQEQQYGPSGALMDLSENLSLAVNNLNIFVAWGHFFYISVLAREPSIDLISGLLNYLESHLEFMENNQSGSCFFLKTISYNFDVI